MLVVATVTDDPIEKGLCLETFVGQKILIGYKVPARIFGATRKQLGHWKYYEVSLEMGY